MQHTGFIYIWYDRKKKWFCIGSRFGTTDDGYITSTGWMTKAHKKRPEDFKRRILEYYYGPDRLELHALEQKWLDKIKDTELCIAVNKTAGTVRYYNMKKKARGLGGIFASELRKAYWASEAGTEHKKRLSEETTKRNRERRGKGTIPWNKGKECPQISAAKRGIKTNRPAWNSGMTCPSISKGRLANPTIYTNEMREAQSIRQKGSKRSEETRAKQSESAKLHTKTKEHKEALSVAAQNRAAQILTCPHCAYTGSATAVKRWHFRNCKFAIV